MRHTSKLFVVLVAAVLIFSLSGCRKPATPDTILLPEDTSNSVDNAVDNPTPEAEDVQPEDSGAETEAPADAETDTESTTEEPADTTEEILESTPTPVPTIEPSPTAVPVTTDPEVNAEPTAEPTNAPVASTGQHTVQAGENLFRIALKYGLTTDQVAKANNITNPALIYVGQVLTIPSGGTGTPGTVPAPTGKTHVVQPGENLFRIALKYGLDQNYLASYNGITNPALIYVGQVLQIP